MISFKSIPQMFEKERDGRKPNTIREMDEFDNRFKLLAESKAHLITIVNTETQEAFTRKITDVSIWKNIMIISWEYKDE